LSKTIIATAKYDHEKNLSDAGTQRTSDALWLF